MGICAYVHVSACSVALLISRLSCSVHTGESSQQAWSLVCCLNAAAPNRGVILFSISREEVQLLCQLFMRLSYPNVQLRCQLFSCIS